MEELVKIREIVKESWIITSINEKKVAAWRIKHEVGDQGLNLLKITQ